MKRIIEVEEIVNVHHQIFVDYDCEEQLDDALNGETVLFDCLEDFVNNLQDCGINVVEVNENYSEDVESVEYYDDEEWNEERKIQVKSQPTEPRKYGSAGRDIMKDCF